MMDIDMDFGEDLAAELNELSPDNSAELDYSAFEETEANTEEDKEETTQEQSSEETTEATDETSTEETTEESNSDAKDDVSMEQLDELEKILQEAQETVEESENSSKEADESVDKIEDKLSEGDTDLQSLKTSLSELKQQNERLQQSISKLITEKSDLSVQNAELKAFGGDYSNPSLLIVNRHYDKALGGDEGSKSKITQVLKDMYETITGNDLDKEKVDSEVDKIAVVESYNNASNPKFKEGEDDMDQYGIEV